MPNVSFSDIKEYEELLSHYMQLQSVEAGLVANLADSQSAHKDYLANQLAQSTQHERSKRQLDENTQNIAIAQAEELTLGTDAFQLALEAISNFFASDAFSNFVYAVVTKMATKSQIIEICVGHNVRLDLKEFNSKINQVDINDMVIIKTDDADINLSQKHLFKNISPKLVQYILQ